MRRGSGILLHITSLPSPYGIGDLGPWAYRFVDFLAETKQSYWQILPLTPTDPASSNSPYHSISAFASNPLLISPDVMVRDGFLAKADIKPFPNSPKGQVDYDAVIAHREKLFYLAYERFKKKRNNFQYERFCSKTPTGSKISHVLPPLKSIFMERCGMNGPRKYGIEDRKL